MKWIPSLILFLSTGFLFRFLGYAQGLSTTLVATQITHDLSRRQGTTDSSFSGNTDTSTLASPDESHGIPPDSTSDTHSSSPPSPSETPTSTDTTSESNPRTSSSTPTVQTSADPPPTSANPPQSTYQSTPGTPISTPTANTGDSTEQTPSHTQRQNTALPTHNTPSITPPPLSPLDSNSIAASSSPIESAVTSVSPTLVLGDLECASDPHAQQDGRCPNNYYCNAALKQCAVQLNNGMTCAADFQCASGYCIGTCANRMTSNNNTQALTGGQIAGITLGTIGGVFVVLVGLLFCYRRRKRRMEAQQSRAMHYMSEDVDQSTEMVGNGKATTRLSKYNFLTQVLDGRQQQSRSLDFESSQQYLNYNNNTLNNNDTHSILDYQNELYVSNTSLNPQQPFINTHSVSSSSTTALRPRPITDDFNIGASSKLRPDSLEQPLQTNSPRMTYRDSMTDTVLSPTLPHRFTEQQQQHFTDINTLWDDALHQTTATTATSISHQRQFQNSPATTLLPPVAHDAWSQEDQASLPSTTSTTPKHDYPAGTVPPPSLPSGQPYASSHRPFF